MTLDNKNHNKILSTNYFKIGMIVSLTAIVSFFIMVQNESFADTMLFFDDFSTYNDQGEADTSWPSSDITKSRVNVTSDVLNFTNVGDNTNISIIHDLGVGMVPDTEWKLQWKMNFTQLTPQANTVMYIGISSTDESSGSDTVQDGIFLKPRFTNLPATTDWSVVATNDQSPNLAGGGQLLDAEDPATDINYFAELERTGPTSFNATIYNDPDFTDVRFTKDFTIPDVSNLRYIKIMNSFLFTAGEMSGFIDDVRLIMPTPTLTCNNLDATIQGTDPNGEILIGTPGDDVIVGLAGMDYIIGNGGNDTICGGDGDDLIRGGEGQDYIDGDGGKDLIMGDEGNDILKGSGGDDKILGGSGADTLKGNNGEDMLSGNSEDDILNGGNGVDVCDNSEPNDTLVDCEISN